MVKENIGSGRNELQRFRGEVCEGGARLRGGKMVNRRIKRDNETEKETESSRARSDQARIMLGP